MSDEALLAYIDSRIAAWEAVQPDSGFWQGRKKGALDELGVLRLGVVVAIDASSPVPLSAQETQTVSAPWQPSVNAQERELQAAAWERGLMARCPCGCGEVREVINPYVDASTSPVPPSEGTDK